jgi:tRNA(Ile)-lysidine synthase
MDAGADLQSRVLATLRSQLRQLAANDRPLWLGLSGGADSVALLLMLANSPFLKQLRVFHINHQLHTDSAHWQGFCEALCERVSVPFVAQKVTLDGASQKRMGLEAAAREARYLAGVSLMKDDHVLVTAHHADDQLETLLMRLERGADLVGLGGMRACLASGESAWGRAHVRPLLAAKKSELEAYLDSSGQSWIEDPSNSDTGLKRNYYRHHVVPQLPQALANQLLEAATKATQSVGLLEHQLGVESADVESADHYLWPGPSAPTALASFRLKRWLGRQGVGLPKSRFNELLRQLELGTGRGQSAFFSAPSYALWVKGRRLSIKR